MGLDKRFDGGFMCDPPMPLLRCLPSCLLGAMFTPGHLRQLLQDCTQPF